MNKKINNMANFFVLLRTSIVVFFMLNSFTMYSQRGDCNEVTNQAAIRLYQEALGKPPYKFKEAIELLERAISIANNFADAYYKLAELTYNQAIKIPFDTNYINKIDNYYTLSEKYFLKVVQICPSYNYYNSYFYLGEFYYNIREFEKSGAFLSTFIDHSSESALHYAEARNMQKNNDYYLFLINNPVPFSPVPLEDVCSEEDEYLPLISPDEELLFYSRRFKKNPNTAFEEYVEEVVMSERDWDDSLNYLFKRGVALAEPFNDGRNQGGASITIDNNHLYITICEYERANYTSFKNCDIFTSDRVNEKWSPLRRMGKEINDKNTFEGMPSITADGKSLFFASAREGGYGGIDIYRSDREKDGTWGLAQNLGPVINTSGDDKTPFIHSDSQTLYFASNGRFGLGGFDVFYSQYQGNGQWSDPKNMGYPINTENDELGLIVSTNGKRVFFSSRTYNKDGNWDIYSASLYEGARPKKVLFVKGRLTDEKGRDVTDAQVGLKGVKSKETTEGMVDAYSGKYAVAVPVKQDEDYLLTVKKDKYFFNSKFIDPNDDKYEPPTTVNMKIEQVEKGKPVRLENVNFATGSYQLDEISKSNINQLIEFMKVNRDVKISLHGHTDNMGGPEYNETLSQLRVQSVRNYMHSQGIDSRRISYKGFGERKPLASNLTKKGRALNRRVEFIIL